LQPRLDRLFHRTFTGSAIGENEIHERNVEATAVFPFADVAMVGRARQIAIKAHGDQKYGEWPYSSHLEATANVLAEFLSYSPELLAAAWLHDTPEDTSETLASLEAQAVSGGVLRLVDACTDGPGKNRKERKQRPLDLIPNVQNSVLLKLGDRIANVRAALHDESKRGLLDMYRKEQAEFYRALKNAPTSLEFDAAPLWQHLSQLLLSV